MSAYPELTQNIQFFTQYFAMTISYEILKLDGMIEKTLILIALDPS